MPLSKSCCVDISFEEVFVSIQPNNNRINHHPSTSRKSQQRNIYQLSKRRKNSTIIFMKSWIGATMILSLLVGRVRASCSSHQTIQKSCAFLSSTGTPTNNRKSILQNSDIRIGRLSIVPTLQLSPLTNNKIQMNYYSSNSINEDENPNDFSLSGYQRPKVNWYPGHIAKAERQLSETLKSVDVVIEVRDARAPKATAHPSVGKWTAGRPRVVVLTRVDTVTTRSRESWRSAYETLGADRWEDTLGGEEKNRNVQLRKERSKYDVDIDATSSSEDSIVGNLGAGVEEVLFVDAKRGQGTHAISRAVYRAGRHVNERRNRRGLNDRPLRVGIIGFPNVGKVSMWIERLYNFSITNISYFLVCINIRSLLLSIVSWEENVLERPIHLGSHDHCSGYE